MKYVKIIHQLGSSNCPVPIRRTEGYGGNVTPGIEYCTVFKIGHVRTILGEFSKFPLNAICREHTQTHGSVCCDYVPGGVGLISKPILGMSPKYVGALFIFYI